ncbi:unnamed protein product [Musa acuminata subsp. malaccensis]|uniref:(wild Malaysian banana) hypothetical protein n=1 Tax=Musa acuminata subsp. malaccensis TaxID=214687 RepID=A0A804IST8_MUSAM|nr:PREDICTED: uncharacterized protein LOC103976813 [Musa acuminata subsp. malaccensis]CAG1843096.1 unnamed protein product [Musa acuminata subsp. malaccensis]
MGQERGLKSEDNFQVRLRPKVVSSCISSSKKVQECDRKGLPRYYDLNRLDSDLRVLGRSYSSSPGYKIMPLKMSDKVPKRGSMYRSSKEVSRMRKLRDMRKVESCCSDDAFFSFDIIDSFHHHGLKEPVLFSHEEHSPLGSMDATLDPLSVDPTDSNTTRSMGFLDLSSHDLPDKNQSLNKSCSSSASRKNSSIDDLFEISLQSIETESHSTYAANEFLRARSHKDQKFHHDQRTDPRISEEIISQLDSVNILPKSFSSKVGMSNIAKLEIALLNASPKIQLTPPSNTSDPIRKTKSLQNSSHLEKENFGSSASEAAKIRRSEVLCESLLNDLSIMAQQMEMDENLQRQQAFITASSPAHLNGILKLETVNGNPIFEFSVKAPEDVLIAKTWKTDNAFNWIYTFHSSNKKINNNSRTKDQDGQAPPMVGQMQVSCFLCSEVREKGSLHNSIAMEFVLYDIAQARRSIMIDERSQCSLDSTHPLTSSVSTTSVKEKHIGIDNSKEHQNPTRNTCSSFRSDASTSCPWSPADLHPQLEIATTIVQIPFDRRKGSKGLKEVTSKENQNLSSYPAVDQEMEICCCLNPATVKVITPSGTHGLPNTDEGGPSTLQDRWRSGGGCDCGGWDMGCPIVVFNNSHADDWVDSQTFESRKSMFLFLQGSKEKVPALSIMADGKGQYLVDFHARLSTLQAFSICIAVLHGFDVASAVIQEKNRQKSHSNSLKLLLEEEVWRLIEAAASEERKVKPTSFLLDAPFSPMGRV